MENKELVYLFLYNPMIASSGWITQSIHKKRKSAVRAMEDHKAKALEQWSLNFKTPEEQQKNPFGKLEDWRVTPMVLED